MTGSDPGPRSTMPAMKILMACAHRR